MSASSRLLAALLRAGDPKTLQRLERALRGSQGSVMGAAAALGIPVSTLYDLRRDVPAVRAVLLEHSMGRAGAQVRAAEARKTRVISRGSEKVQKMSCSRGGPKGGRFSVSLDSQGGEGE